MEILEPIWKGLITGVMFTLTFGTVFFSLIQTSIKRGHRKSLYIATGVLFSDAIYISIAVFGSTFITSKIEHYDHIIRIIGFSFLAFLGIRSILKHEKIKVDENQSSEKKDILYVMKGIMLNSINPMTLLAWIGIATYVQTVNQFNFDQVLLFFAVVLGMMFTCMFGIVYSAGKLRDILSERNLHRLNIFSGIIFIIFAIVIIFPVVMGLF
ncbi:MAG: LysE family transporter [Bacteroidota bacterium]